jgi:hypothetical protein
MREDDRGTSRCFPLVGLGSPPQRPLLVHKASLPLAVLLLRIQAKYQGIALTLLALATSMFWFPEPEQPDPEVLEFLAAEEEYLTGDWTLAKVLMSLLVPASFAALALAFWKRSLFYGLAVINAIVLTKIAWSFYYGGDSGWALLPPVLVGVAICDAVILYVAHRMRGKAIP